MDRNLTPRVGNLDKLLDGKSVFVRECFSKLHQFGFGYYGIGLTLRTEMRIVSPVGLFALFVGSPRHISGHYGPIKCFIDLEVSTRVNAYLVHESVCRCIAVVGHRDEQVYVGQQLGMLRAVEASTTRCRVLSGFNTDSIAYHCSVSLVSPCREHSHRAWTINVERK